jgi:NAD(P)-dependent dehydrogenase (short-subunit alcohol dehydrogenase family)
MPALKNKVAVITGGSSGIGLATAKRFGEEGAYVFITGRRQSELDKAVKEIGRNAIAIQGDISKVDDLERLYKEIAQKKGKIDIVVANAAVVEMVPTQAVTPEHYDKTFDTNARGTYFTVQKALPLLNDGGSIILIGSGVWLKGYPAYGTYAATKAALRSFVRNLDDGTEGSQDSRESHQPGRGRNSHHRRSISDEGSGGRGAARVPVNHSSRPAWQS